MDAKLNYKEQSLTQNFNKDIGALIHKLAEITNSYKRYTQMTFEVSLNELTKEDKKLVTEFLTTRNNATDYPIVLEMLRAKVKAQNLKACFEFLQSRGNIVNDHRVVISLLESGVKSEHLTFCFDFLVSRGNMPADVPLLVEFGRSCQD